jgi:hypothetical protein
MQPTPTIRKLAPQDVPFGPQISTRGKFVWAAYSDDKLICVAATAPGVRRMYKEAVHRFHKERDERASQ